MLVVTCAAGFLTPFMASALNLAIPAIGRDLGASPVVLNWIVGAYLVAAAAFLLPCGRLADLHGRRRVFVTGLLAHGAFSGAAALATSPGALIALRLLQGLGGAMLFSTSVAILTSGVPAGERGRALGLNTSSIYAGLSLGPILGGLLTQHAGWRSIFALNAVVALGVALAALAGLRRERGGAAAARLDVASAALYSASLVALLAGTSALRSLPGASWLLALGAVGLAGFVLRERRSPTPLLEIALFADPVFAFSNLAALVHYSSTFALGFLLSLYLQSVRGFDAQTAGLILLAQPFLMMLLSAPAGRLSDRVQPRLVASAGMALTAAGLAALATLGQTSPLGHVLIGLVLVGVGFGLFTSPNTNAVMSAVARPHYGVAAATLATMRMVGQAASMALVSAVLAGFVGAGPPAAHGAPALLRGMRVALALFAGLCGLGTAASLARGRLRR